MELHADQIVTRNRRGDRPAIVRSRQHIALPGAGERIGMHEIRMGMRRQTFGHRVGAHECQLVPTDLRNLECGIRRRHAHHLAANPAQYTVISEFAAHIRHQLHADADAEEWNTLADDSFIQDIDHTRHRRQTGHAIGKGADARQHDPIGPGDNSGVGGDDDLMPRAALGGNARQGLLGRTEIAGAVIDQGNKHRAPRTGPSTKSATRRARRIVAEWASRFATRRRQNARRKDDEAAPQQQRTASRGRNLDCEHSGHADDRQGAERHPRIAREHGIELEENVADHAVANLRAAIAVPAAVARKRSPIASSFCFSTSRRPPRPSPVQYTPKVDSITPTTNLSVFSGTRDNGLCTMAPMASTTTQAPSAPMPAGTIKPRPAPTAMTMNTTSSPSSRTAL